MSDAALLPALGKAWVVGVVVMVVTASTTDVAGVEESGSRRIQGERYQD